MSLSLMLLVPSMARADTVNDGSYENFVPCQQIEANPATGPQTLSEWATCSAAYTADKARGEMLLTAFLGLAMLTCVLLLLATRR